MVEEALDSSSAQRATIPEPEVESAESVPFSDEPVVAVMTEEASLVTLTDISPHQAPTETNTGITDIDLCLHPYVSLIITQRVLPMIYCISSPVQILWYIQCHQRQKPPQPLKNHVFLLKVRSPQTQNKHQKKYHLKPAQLSLRRALNQRQRHLLHPRRNQLLQGPQTSQQVPGIFWPILLRSRKCSSNAYGAPKVLKGVIFLSCASKIFILSCEGLSHYRSRLIMKELLG